MLLPFLFSKNLLFVSEIVRWLYEAHLGLRMGEELLMLLTWKSAHILAWSNKVYTLILLLLFKASLGRGECCLCRWSLFCQWCWSLWLSSFPLHSALIFPGFLSRLDMTFQKKSNYSDSKKDQNLPGFIGNEGWVGKAQRTLRVVEGSCVITGDNSDRCAWV